MEVVQHYAFEYYLRKLIPKNSTIGVVAPKTILAQIIPKIAKDKAVRVVGVRASEVLKGLSRGSWKDVEFVVVEADGTAKGGVLLSAEETSWVEGKRVIALCAHGEKSVVPVSHDVVQAEWVVTEKGIVSGANLILF